MNNEELSAVQSLDDVTDIKARDKLNELIEKTYVLGAMIWGSRATRFGQQNTDWDILIYVTEEFFQTLDIEDIAILEYDESEGSSKRLVIDYTYFSDSIFEDQLNSPLDIDHSAYAEGIVIHDPTGKLEEWRKKLAYYPEEEHTIRVKLKFIQMRIAFYQAQMGQKRNLPLDCQLNLQRTIQCAVNFWFTLKKTWTPPLKWWSKYVKQLGMEDEHFKLFSASITKPTIENVGELIKSLVNIADNQGIDFKTFNRDFLETIFPKGRKNLMKHSYI
ncbi:MAG: DUF4037 domain-containing protein [Candidatus Hodarchaeales archaeon]|jgi:hypothetical protein